MTTDDGRINVCRRRRTTHHRVASRCASSRDVIESFHETCVGETRTTDSQSLASPTGVTDWRHRLASPTGVTDWRHRLASPTDVTDWHHRLTSPTGVNDWRHRLTGVTALRDAAEFAVCPLVAAACTPIRQPRSRA